MGIDEAGVLARIQQLGLQSATLHDLVAMILSREEGDVGHYETAAADLVRRYPGKRLVDLGQSELHSIAGLEQFEGLRILAAIEIGRRAGQSRAQLVNEISSVEDAFRLFEWLAEEKQEHFCAAYLNTKGAVISTKVIHIGTLNMSLVGAREVFREAVRENAASVVVAHNHPSGDPTPSPEDLSLTQRLVEAGTVLDVKVLDHVIIGSKGNVSLMREGLI